MQRPAFLDQDPPPGYIPGIGRGATGFSTRGDNNKKIPKRLQGENIRTSSYNFKQNDINEDLEAEKIFGDIDSKLAKRSRAWNKKNEASNNHNNDNNNVINVINSTKISGNFNDLKQSLSNVTDDQWLNIPEAGDITKRNKRQRLEDQLLRKSYAAPDTLLSNQLNLSKLTEERDRLLGRQLDSSLMDTGFEDKKKDDVGKYLQELDGIAPNNDETNDDSVNNMRVILQSYIKSDKQHPEGWLASARLEERGGRIKAARSIIADGSKYCPRSEDIWLENIRLNEIDKYLCKTLVAKAIRFNPDSLALWIKAIDLEDETINKQRVVRKAIQEISNQEELWKLAIEYESEDNEKLRIALKAVQFVPKSIYLWKTLVKFQPHDDAKISLNKVKTFLPNEPQVLIMAANIEEKFNKNCTVDTIVDFLIDGIKELQENGTTLPLLTWIKEAQNLGKEPTAKYTSEAIIIAALISESGDLYSSENIQQIKNLESTSSKITVLKYLLQHNPGKLSLWKLLSDICYTDNKSSILFDVFQSILFEGHQGSDVLKGYPVLALMYSKAVWKKDCDVDRAIKILEQTLTILPKNLDIWLAKIKLFSRSSRLAEVRSLFEDSIQKLPVDEVPNIERLYYKYISFLRYQNENEKAIQLLENDYIQKFSSNHKFYLQLGQIYETIGDIESSRKWLKYGTEKIPSCPALWVSLSKLDECSFNNSVKARADLDMAILKNPKEELLFLAKAQLEKRLGNVEQASLVVSQGLKQLSSSAVLWVEKIKLSNSKKPISKKTLFQDALKNTSNSYLTLLEIGISFYQDLQFQTALKWLHRSTKSNPRYGDSWVWLARCYIKLKTPINSCREQIEEVEPTHGPEWISISKDINTQYLKPSDILDRLLQKKC
ncbi:hypothetical protein Kpol_1061p12 [Vanderwaltozyma polyspora DSM 70294]|uniref:PRP1 splicing factor N-terminal domain-containing protein n=1 Tax=Vanderwaltozyma polyspora (strain ATCC 22028 / DSM 70294 / BCRC 21397 / CBS 2163 / NBRC 10782 / NRRL Y-8283 / UCD 57-17) TaxID=436907 RepID=A7TJE0_VANPO|nr:uncharacterized protein Kpol_1061p12 [Vanderwaltozyma polyspora DSM 70294]EDO17590.1 hypothetical protein Kpol_1061p12 [Vanderwaltozyma polyspora DSM 70294]